MEKQFYLDFWYYLYQLNQFLYQLPIGNFFQVLFGRPKKTWKNCVFKSMREEAQNQDLCMRRLTRIFDPACAGKDGED